MRGIVLVIVMVLAAAVPAAAQDAGWIGISIEDQKDRGAVVRRIEPNSPAEKAGLKEGDVIVEFDKQEVIGAQQLTRLVRETPTGRTIDVGVRRDNRQETFKVTTEQAGPFGLRQGQFSFNMPNMPNMPDLHVWVDPLRNAPRVQVSTVFVQSGIRVEQMTDQLRDFFGANSTGGVLVTSVDSGSAAEKAGVKTGDVITTIDGRNVRTPAEFSREMRAGSRPSLKVLRDKKERDIRIE